MQQLKLNADQHGHLGPRAWTYICALPDDQCFHGQHGKRHPRSIYRQTLQNITQQFTVVLDLIGSLENRYRSDKENLATEYSPLLKAYRELLYRLNEHHDACLSILRSLCPPDMAKPTNFDSTYLLKARLPGAKAFMEATKEYREAHIGLLVNTMKHSQGELSSIYLYSKTDFRPGYFLCDVLPDGMLGPCGKLHSEGRTAFSFSRDLKIHALWLYKIGDLLSTAISSAIDGLYKTNLPIAACELDAPYLLQMLRGCAALELRFFPDEMKKPYPHIFLAEDNSKLTMEFRKMLTYRLPDDMKFRTALVVDKAHPSTKLPYFGSDYAAWQKSIE
jgi:hypothetical protein